MMQTQTDYATWFLILGPVTLLMVLGIIVVFVALFWHDRTRPIGWGLLGVLGLAAVLFFLAMPVRTTIVRNGATVPLVQFPNDSHPSTFVPAIELAQASKDMNATAPVAEVVEKLNGAEDDNDSVAVSNENEVATAEPPKSSAKEEPELPNWVTALPNSVGGVWRQVISSGPRVDVTDCSLAIDSAARATVQQFLAQIAQEEGLSPHAYIPEMLGISTNWIRENVFCSTPEPYVQTTSSSVGPMKTLYVQLEFDPNDKEFLRQKYIGYIRRDRIAAVTTGGVFALGGIGLLFGLFKVDTWTKGYYTKRLFLGVPAAIIGVGTLLALMMS